MKKTLKATEDLVLKVARQRGLAWEDDFGNEVIVHDPSHCEGEICCIHNPSDHVMKDFKKLFRSRFGMPLIERICPHGVGHPDPDHLSSYKEKYGEKAARYESIHGCDGCCREKE